MRRNRALVIFALIFAITVSVFWLGTVLADATIQINTGLTVTEGSSGNNITESELLTDDPLVVDATIFYTIDSTPTNGDLFLDGVTLTLGSVFTQTDIANNLLTYSHNDSETLTDSFDFTATTTDTEALSASSTFTFTIEPIFDQTPVVDDQIFSVDENSTIGTAVGTIITSDLDVGDAITYTIIAGNLDTAFAVGSGDGEITVDNSTPLDFETNESISFTVEVEDSGMLTDTAVITVDINNINEAPILSGGPFDILENSANTTSVGTVTNSDVDAGDTFTYTITASDPITPAFAIGSSTGEITVTDTTQLNFETTPTYTLTVEVIDSGLLTDTADIIINLLDDNDAPILSPAGPFEIAEDAPNSTQVGTPISATDEDISAGDVLTYTITGGNPGAPFGIGPSNGQITVINSTILDFDTPPASYNLAIQVTDSEGATDSEIVVVNLTDVNEPPIASNTTFMINENLPDGQPVGTVPATDPEDDSLEFIITAGNSGAPFAINAMSGAITVNDSSLLNFETTPTFTLTVTVDDGTNPVDTATITIDLNDLNESPTISNAVANIDENSSNGTAVVTVPSSDPDEGDSLTFEILTGNIGNAFAIDNDGNITVAASGQLDYENIQSYTLGILATDDGNLTNTANVTININNLFDEAPTVNGATFFASEGSDDGVALGTVSASDPEFGSGDELTFSIIGGNIGNVFAINSSTGQITVPDTSKLDADSMPIFNLTIQVTDLGGEIDTATVTINVSPLPITFLYLPLLLNNYPLIEPNNNCGEAYGIGTGIDYEFTADDTEDWYSVTLTSAGNLTAVLSSFEPAQGQLIVYGGTCNSLVLLQNNGDPTTTKIINLGNRPAGTYYIRVFSDPVTNTTYTLRVN